MNTRSKACPMCEGSLLPLRGLWFCEECGFRIGLAEPFVSHEEVADATRHYVAKGGVITRLPDGPEPMSYGVRLNEEIVGSLRPLPWDEVVTPGSNWTLAQSGVARRVAFPDDPTEDSRDVLLPSETRREIRVWSGAGRCKSEVWDLAGCDGGGNQ